MVDTHTEHTSAATPLSHSGDGGLLGLRSAHARFMAIWLWCHVPIVGLLLWALGLPNVMGAVLVVAGIAATVSIVLASRGPHLLFQYTLAVGYPGIVALMVASFSLQPDTTRPRSSAAA